MTDLSEKSLDDVLVKLANILENQADRITARPSHLIVQPNILRQALKILYYKPPIRRVSGARKRKLALYWRKP
jgi:hypothetical protein